MVNKEAVETGRVSAKSFCDREIEGFLLLLSMLHVHHDMGPVPTERGIKVKGADVRKVEHSDTCFQEPAARHGGIEKDDTENSYFYRVYERTSINASYMSP